MCPEDLDSIQKVSYVIDALEQGELKVHPKDEWWVHELRSLRRGATGLLDITGLSTAALRMARLMSMAVNARRQKVARSTETSDPLPHGGFELQRGLFSLYEKLFLALVGTSSEKVESPTEIKARMLDRLRTAHDEFAKNVNATAEEVREFYNQHSKSMFTAAAAFGGVKVVIGGQRQFLGSTLSAARISCLYCDTQLIPDPVYPFFAGELHLSALHLQLAIVLFYILPLRPLVDAHLSPPPIWVFPSFEEHLERADAMTQSGLAELALKVITPICNAKIESLEELVEFAKHHEQDFLDAISREGLFVPPGGDPAKRWSASEAAIQYLKELQGVRDSKILEQMRAAPQGVVVLMGLLERLRPQYHLLENADELDAQPLLTQEAQWYYFERCAQAQAGHLVREHIMPREALDQIRSMQDDSLGWLSRIPIDGLVELRERMEHTELREKLKRYTNQLGEAKVADLGATLKEVRHGLESLIQQQRNAIRDLQSKYAATMRTELVGAATGGIGSAFITFLPFLAQFPHLTPVASGITALGTGGIAAIKETQKLLLERQRLTRKTMLGMLATARDRRVKS